jgi:hypothetical protein
VKWFRASRHSTPRRRAAHTAPPQRPRQRSVPRPHGVPGPCSFPRLTRAPRRSNPAPRHAPARRRTVPRPGARCTVRRSVRDSSSSCVVPWPGSSPVVTPASEPPYLRHHCIPEGEHRAGRPPLPPSRQARPSTGTPEPANHLRPSPRSC